MTVTLNLTDEEAEWVLDAMIQAAAETGEIEEYEQVAEKIRAQL